MFSKNQLHEAALRFARAGIHVFPCQPKGKAPACRSGVHDATTNEDRINAWWGGCPDLNIGIATGSISGFFVLDIDSEAGEARIRELEQKFGPLPPTVEVITGKGRQLYFAATQPIGNTVAFLGEGVDTRGDGGYVIAPPSIHPSGKAYTWSVDSTDKFADPPGWLLDLLGAADDKAKEGKPLEHWHAKLSHKITNGERNSTLASIAGKLFHHGLNPVLVYDLLLNTNIARCEEPLSESEIETITISIGRKHVIRAAT